MFENSMNVASEPGSNGFWKNLFNFSSSFLLLKSLIIFLYSLLFVSKTKSVPLTTNGLQASICNKL